MLDEIVFQNPWWKSGRVDAEKLGSIKRTVFDELVENLRSKKVTCLVGPRRTGKTTLTFEMIDHLLKAGVPRQNIIYASMDNAKIRLYLEQSFDELMKEYATEKIGESPSELSKTVYVFLDEVHKLSDWGNKVKYWQDLGFKIKFTVTGSPSARILKGGGESLQGRISVHVILPLLFSEFCGESITADITNIKELGKAHARLLPEKQRFWAKLEEYLLKGGYPEIFFEKDVERAYQELRNYKTLTITREILDMKDIKEPRALSDLFDLLSDSMSERINYSQFAKLLKIKVDTVKSYMTYFEECFLIATAYQYSTRQVVSTRKEKKLFFVDHGLRNAMLLKDINDIEKSKIVENAVFIHLLSRKKQELFPKMFFWMDEAKREVDFAVRLGKTLVPVEVKYQNTITSSDEKTLRKFMSEFGCSRGIIITKDILEEKNGVTLIPAWLFLLTA